MHARNLAGFSMDHDLDRAAGPVGARQIDALLELDPLLVGVEGPHLLAGQHQDCAMAVAVATRLDEGVEVEAHCESIATAAGKAEKLF